MPECQRVQVGLQPSTTFVASRQTERTFSVTTLLDTSHFVEGMQAGLTAYAAPLNHYDVVVKRNSKLYVKSNIRLGELAHCYKEIELKGKSAYLRITSDKDYYYLEASSDGKKYEPLGRMDFRYLSTEVIGGFTGVMLGVFAQCPDNKRFSDFDWVE